MSWYCCPNTVKPLIIKCQRESYKFTFNWFYTNGINKNRHTTEIAYEKTKTIFTKQNDVSYNESSMGEEGKSEDDQESIHNDETGRDDDGDEEEDNGNHGNYNNDYKVPRLQQVQQQCNYKEEG